MSELTLEQLQAGIQYLRRQKESTNITLPTEDIELVARIKELYPRLRNVLFEVCCDPWFDGIARIGFYPHTGKTALEVTPIYLSLYTVDRFHVLCHEMAHALLGHIYTQHSHKESDYAFSRCQEYDADMLGAIILEQLGYDPLENIEKVWQTVAEQDRRNDGLGTHPKPEDRLSRIQQVFKCLK